MQIAASSPLAIDKDQLVGFMETLDVDYNITNIESVIDMDILQRWNFLYPPSKIEIQHMWKIFYIQGNINPFVVSIQR